MKHRVIPRDFQLDAVRDLPLHVDFMRLGEGATIRVNIPIIVKNADQSPGVKRGGTVSIVAHTVEVRCLAEAIPTGIEVDVGSLDINHSKHLSDIKLPEGVRSVSNRDVTLGHRRAAVGLCGRIEGRCRSRCRCSRRCCRRRCGSCRHGRAGCSGRRACRWWWCGRRRACRWCARRSEVAALARDDADAAPGRTW